MSRLKVADRIRAEENSKVRPIIRGLVIIIIVWVLSAFILRIPSSIRLVVWVVLVLTLLYLIFEWYKAYYK